MTVLNVDLDGVVYDFNRAMFDFINDRAPGRLDMSWEEAIPRSWTYWSQWNMSKGEWVNWFRLGVESGYIWRHGEVYGGAVETLWNLSDEGVFIRVVTARLAHHGLHEQAVRNTVDWLEENNVPFRALSFEADKQNFAWPGSFLVDDKPENITAYVDRARRYGFYNEVAAMLMARSWNDGIYTWSKVGDVVLDTHNTQRYA